MFRLKRFSALVKYQVFRTIIDARWVWLIALVYPIAFCLGPDGFGLVLSAGAPTGGVGVHRSEAATLLSLVGGGFPFAPSLYRAFTLPMGWILLTVLPVFAVISGAGCSLGGRASSIDALAGSRSLRFASSCMAAAILTCLYGCYALLCTVVIALFCGASFGLPATGVVPQDALLLSAGGTSLPEDSAVYQVDFGWVCGLAAIATLWITALSMTCMLLSLVIERIPAFSVVLLYTVFSTYYPSPWLLGDYGMAYRSALVISGGVDVTVAAGAALIVGGGAVLVGWVLLRRLSCR